MSLSVEGESDPTYTHFAHRDGFLRLLKAFLELDLSFDPDEDENEGEERSMISLGLIVRRSPFVSWVLAE